MGFYRSLVTPNFFSLDFLIDKGRVTGNLENRKIRELKNVPFLDSCNESLRHRSGIGVGGGMVNFAQITANFWVKKVPKTAFLAVLTNTTTHTHSLCTRREV